MNKIFKIGIIGNSVALRNRPPLEAPLNLNYGGYLQRMLNEGAEDKLFMVENHAYGRATIRELYRDLDRFICTLPEVFVLNIGVVDASTREIPIWISDILNSRKEDFFHRTIRGIHHHLFKKSRAFWVKLRGNKAWISQKEFREKYNLILDTISKESNADVLLMTINTGNDRIERNIPGSLENYVNYNKIIEEIADKRKLALIDSRDLDSSEYFPDGIHFNRDGHRLIAERIKAYVEQIIQKRDNVNV